VCFADSERSLILERLEAQLSEARDLEFSRKDVLERMDDESWLEEYSRV
jgi:Ase1/PRC1/MAP65 family protein